jgi:nicotinate-nucleotide pyrophosphorylase (carboxylating)
LTSYLLNEYNKERLTVIDPIQLSTIVRRALEEDIGAGDVTSTWTIPTGRTGRGVLFCKAEGVLAGLQVAGEVFAQVSADLKVQAKSDGDLIVPGDRIATVKGPMAAILTAERTALNLLQRMSGIATMTRRYVEAVAGTKAVILDTRKTVPGLRLLDKWAVRTGGGQNHRMRLDDMVLIKDNHIAASGGITHAVERVRKRNVQELPIEVEVKTWAQLEEAVPLQLDRIMLDNMSLDEMRRAAEWVAGRVPLEASGGITLDTVRAVAETGVDYISVGALTHSAIALDISLEVE